MARRSRRRRSGAGTLRVGALRGARSPRAGCTYPDALPITARRDELLATIRDHQVVVVAGETGSGKSTQLPKLCLELGRGVDGLIGHTQPRRVAARTIAERVADELGSTIGGDVGLLGALRRPGARRDARAGDDRRHPARRAAPRSRPAPLRHADHRRGPRAQPQRRLHPRLPPPAAAAPARPQGDRHVGDDRHGPLRPPLRPRRRRRAGRRGDRADVPGRGALPPVRRRGGRAPSTAATRSRRSATPCDELAGIGDTLVFLSGEREIHDTADFLRRRDLHDTEVLPLYARLSAQEQHRIFQPHRGRRIVLGHERRRDVDHRARRAHRRRHRHGAHLPLQPAVEGATTSDRAGVAGVGRPAGRALRARRAGRVHPALQPRRTTTPAPEFTEPEILRTNLASVILQMTAIGLGDVASFPFVEPPDHCVDPRRLPAPRGARRDRGGRRPTAQRRLTPIGRRLARLPGRSPTRADDPRVRAPPTASARCS